MPSASRNPVATRWIAAPVAGTDADFLAAAGERSADGVGKAWWHAAFGACAQCIGGTLAGHLATCVVATPVLTTAFSVAASSLTNADVWLGYASPAVFAAGAYTSWWARRGRLGPWPIKGLNAATTAAAAVLLMPCTPMGQWTHWNIAEPVHAEIWYALQPAKDQAAIRFQASLKGVSPNFYIRKEICRAGIAPR